MFSRVVNRGAVVSLIVSRLAYGVNWFNIAAVYPLMAVDFNQGVSGLGLLTASFYLGIGVFQLPAGVLAAKFGPKKMAVYGTLLSSLAVLLSGLVFDFYLLVTLRFLIGIGMAFVFAPTIILIAQYFEKGSEGLGTGFLFSAYNLGGAIGLFGWTLLAELIDWRLSLVVAGIFGVASSLLLQAYLPTEGRNSDTRIRFHDLRKVLFDRWIIILGVGLLGVGVGMRLVSDFMVFYLERGVGVAGAVAGSVSSLSMLSALISAPLVGRIYDRLRTRKKLLLFISGTILAAGVAISAEPTIYGAIASTLVVGFAFGAATTIGFSASREARNTSHEYRTLAVGWSNSISLVGGFWSPLIFSNLASTLGYSVAWLVGGVYTLALMIPVLFGRED